MQCLLLVTLGGVVSVEVRVLSLAWRLHAVGLCFGARLVQDIELCGELFQVLCLLHLLPAAVYFSASSSIGFLYSVQFLVVIRDFSLLQ